MKNKLDPQDSALFRRAMQGVKPLKAGPARAAPQPPTSSPRKQPVQVKPLAEDPFSDYETLDPVGSEDSLSFARSGISARFLRRLQRGDKGIEASLDLHGKTIEEARQVLYQFLLQCQAAGRKQVLIVHGKGRFGNKPILKNKLNHWLRQTELVLAFCSAKLKDGGTGAVYVLLKSA